MGGQWVRVPWSASSTVVSLTSIMSQSSHARKRGRANKERDLARCAGRDKEGMIVLGHTLRGRTTTQRSKKGSEKVLEGFWGRVLRRVRRRGRAMGVTVKRGSEKEVSRRVPRTPPSESTTPSAFALSSKSAM